jgi:hypothetical protein
MPDALEILRQDALVRRIKGVAGGLHIVWSAKDIARISDHVTTMPMPMILRDVPVTNARKPANNIAAARRKFSEQGIVLRAAQSDDLNFMFIVSSEAKDLANDVVTVAGIDYSDFLKNPAVLNSHDSSAMPVAVSTSPLVSGKALTAIAEFPQPGVSECSDQTAAALRAKLIKGASIGFVPLKWTFTKDPSRPFGIDFHETKLLEWSICALPCNLDCLMIGAVAGKSARRSSSRTAPLDDVGDEDTNDWQCQGSDALPLDISDDPYDAAAAKVALLESCSPGGTIIEKAADYFLAVDVSAPLAGESFQFPFCRVTESGIVAAKIGWRQSLASLEKSTMPGMPVNDARSLIDRLEVRLGKTAARRREARALVATIKTILASTGDDPAPITRDQRLAEAHNFRRVALGGK